MVLLQRQQTPGANVAVPNRDQENIPVTCNTERTTLTTNSSAAPIEAGRSGQQLGSAEGTAMEEVGVVGGAEDDGGDDSASGDDDDDKPAKDLDNPTVIDKPNGTAGDKKNGYVLFEAMRWKSKSCYKRWVVSYGDGLMSENFG